MCVQPQLWQTKTFWSLLKNIIDADSEEENDMNNAASIPTSSEIRIMKMSSNSRKLFVGLDENLKSQALFF
ncbi:hypothetical protein TNCV_3262921 [Trichonephila clavipes]|nr:hypothetical protein TNCV_3262921 [Trichonephila clavipes]